MTRHFLDLSDAGGDALAAMINDAMARKAARAWRISVVCGKEPMVVVGRIGNFIHSCCALMRSAIGDLR